MDETNKHTPFLTQLRRAGCCRAARGLCWRSGSLLMDWCTECWFPDALQNWNHYWTPLGESETTRRENSFRINQPETPSWSFEWENVKAPLCVWSSCTGPPPRFSQTNTPFRDRRSKRIHWNNLQWLSPAAGRRTARLSPAFLTDCKIKSRIGNI